MAYLKTSATLLDQLTDGSGNFLVTSVGVTPTTTALSASAAGAVTTGIAVTFTATVTPSAATGMVSFFDGAVSIGASAISSGQALLSTTALAVGTHSLTAVYNGDSTYDISTSPPLSFTILSGSFC